jgi:calmodulin
MTAQTLAEYKEVFYLFDKDHDGQITLHEIDAVFKSFGRAFSRSEILDLINETDANANGAIDFDEFLVMLTSHVSSSDVNEELKHAFQMFDIDRNGLITIAELRQLMANLGEDMSDKELNEIIRVVDLNGDGEISIEGIVYKRLLLHIAALGF